MAGDSTFGLGSLFESQVPSEEIVRGDRGKALRALIDERDLPTEHRRCANCKEVKHYTKMWCKKWKSGYSYAVTCKACKPRNRGRAKSVDGT